ncbi:MAG: hypothetical protein AAF799_19290 [Myxococcota bacterium]
MLRIRRKQKWAISPGNPSFVDEMAVHLERHFPTECAKLSDPELRRAIEHGVSKASTYGIGLQRDVCKLLNLMFCYGLDFDLDPQYDWMRTFLNGAKEQPTLQVERLYRRALARAEPPTGLGPAPRRPA